MAYFIIVERHTLQCKQLFGKRTIQLSDRYFVLTTRFGTVSVKKKACWVLQSSAFHCQWDVLFWVEPEEGRGSGRKRENFKENDRCNKMLLNTVTDFAGYSVISQNILYRNTSNTSDIHTYNYA